MGPSPAVSRYHQQFRFFMCDDSPNLNDHDFPNLGYLLVMSGYQKLKIRDGNVNLFNDPAINDAFTDNDIETVDEEEQVENDRFIIDKIKRKHFRGLHAGPSLLVLRACKFNPSSIQTHINDLLPVLRATKKNDGKGIAFVKVDNGSDWNLMSFVNEFYLCRL